MKRWMMKRLIAWKNDAHRKPLILDGARQTGKSWLVKELGRTQFESMAYVWRTMRLWINFFPVLYVLNG